MEAASNFTCNIFVNMQANIAKAEVQYTHPRTML